MPQSETEHRITVGELRELLRPYPDDCEITFGATLAGTPLVFYRVKNRSSTGKLDLVQIELNELHFGGHE